MAAEKVPTLVPAEWLAGRLDDPALRIVDANFHLDPYFLPSEHSDVPRDAGAEFLGGHIPGAVRFDLDAFRDPRRPWWHMLPDPQTFAAKAGALGLGDGCHVVVYGGYQEAARVWWMFRVFGHDAVSVLDGGIRNWLTPQRRAWQRGQASPQPAVFTPRYRPELVRTLDQVRADLAGGEAQVVDARTPVRFAGDPSGSLDYLGLKNGHMPGAKNLTAIELLDRGTVYLPPDGIAAAFRRAGVDVTRPVTATSNSGFSACRLALGLNLLGHRDAAAYDGAWWEWGSRDDTPIETGAG